MNLVSLFGIEYGVRRIVRASESAYAARRLEDVGRAGMLLLHSKLSPAYAGIGAYFAGLAELDNGKGNLKRSKELFEIAVNVAPEPIKTRALLSLGATAGYSGDTDSELRFYHETLRSGADRDAFSFIETNRGIAHVQLFNGDAGAALKTLDNIYPVARAVASSHPRLWSDLHNSYAYGLFKAGRIDEAEAASKVALTSPYARVCPEYQETEDEIAEHKKKGSVAVKILIPLREQKRFCQRILLHGPPKTITKMYLAATKAA